MNLNLQTRMVQFALLSLKIKLNSNFVYVLSSLYLKLREVNYSYPSTQLNRQPPTSRDWPGLLVNAARGFSCVLCRGHVTAAPTRPESTVEGGSIGLAARVSSCTLNAHVSDAGVS